MANNRMCLKCKTCGKWIPIAKSMGGGYYLSPVFSEERLNDFLDRHTFCIDGPDGAGGGNEGDYCIAYEFPEDGQEGRDEGKCEDWEEHGHDGTGTGGIQGASEGVP